jgi:hypothetical protein
MEIHSPLDALGQFGKMEHLLNLIARAVKANTHGGRLAANGMGVPVHVFRGRLPQEDAD